MMEQVAQSEDPEDFVAPAANRVRAGTLLLANTDLLEPTFRRSVIYIVEHNDGGTLGVVLNRASETAVYNVLPQWAKLATKPKTMFIGGPVKRDAALCLATLRVGMDPTGVAGLRHVQGRMVMVDLDAEPEVIAPMVEGVRIFAGYSGWTIGQLEGEIERDDWIVLSALPSDVLVEPRVDLWGRVLAPPAAAAVASGHAPDRHQPQLIPRTACTSRRRRCRIRPPPSRRRIPPRPGPPRTSRSASSPRQRWRSHRVRTR